MTTSKVGPCSDDLAQQREAYLGARLQCFYPKTDAPVTDEVLRALRDANSPSPPDAEGVGFVCEHVLGERPRAIELLPEQGTFHRLHRAVMRGGHSVVVRS